MSKIGQWRLELQGLPEYEAGWDACEAARGDYAARIIPEGLTVNGREAWRIGFDDCIDDHRAGGDEP